MKKEFFVRSFDAFDSKSSDSDKGVVRLHHSVLPQLKRGDLVCLSTKKGSVVRIVRRSSPHAEVCDNTIGLQYEDRRILGANGRDDTTEITITKPFPVWAIVSFFANHPDPLKRYVMMMSWGKFFLGLALGVVLSGFF